MSLDQNLNKILIIDFGSQFTQLIARRIRELGVFSEIISHKKIKLKDIDQTVKGIILSGGPLNVYQINKYSFDKKIINLNIPILGICFGHQILGRALGFETYKLQFGHRGINQPVMDKNTGKVEITAHNHGFAVKAPTDSEFSTVYGRGEVTHTCLNDGVVEGLALLDRPAFSVQYHPEAAPGPNDATYFFAEFAELIELSR